MKQYGIKEIETNKILSVVNTFTDDEKLFLRLDYPHALRIMLKIDEESCYNARIVELA